MTGVQTCALPIFKAFAILIKVGNVGVLMPRSTVLIYGPVKPVISPNFSWVRCLDSLINFILRPTGLKSNDNTSLVERVFYSSPRK